MRSVDRKFKVGDLIIPYISNEFWNIFSDKIYEVERFEKDNDKSILFLKNFDCNAKTENGFWEGYFRLITPAEVRKFKGFSKELEELMNEN